MKVVHTQALVDSSADISCIDQDIVKKYNLSTIKLVVPIRVWNADHSHNKNRDIWYTCDLFLDICYNSTFSLNGLGTFSSVHLILSQHMTILSQGTLIFYLFSHEIHDLPYAYIAFF